MVGALGVTDGVMDPEAPGATADGVMEPDSESLGVGATMGGRMVASSFLRVGASSGLITRVRFRF